jgi:hypothetical protein
MKLDTDPGRAREFEVLWLLILLAFAVASLSDLLNAPGWNLITDTPMAADADAQPEVVLEPWFPSVPAGDPSRSQSMRRAVPSSPAGNGHA